MRAACARTLSALSVVAFILASVLLRPHLAMAQQAACAPTAVVRVVAPAPDDKHSTVSAEVAPDMSLKNPTAGDPKAFHLDYFVDTDPTTFKVGDAVPSGNPKIIHTDAKKVDLNLASGPHTVSV